MYAQNFLILQNWIVLSVQGSMILNAFIFVLMTQPVLVTLGYFCYPYNQFKIFDDVFIGTSLGSLEMSLLYDATNNALHCTIVRARVSVADSLLLCVMTCVMIEQTYLTWRCKEKHLYLYTMLLNLIFWIIIRLSKDGTYYVMALSVRPWSFQFSGLFFALFAAIGLKLGVLLCSQELLFQFAFRCDWFIFARVMPLELSRIADFFSFPDFFLLSLQL
jgi:hypothetical protein